jgi:hypothetical protein
MVEMEASTGWSKDEGSDTFVHPQDPGQRVLVRASPFFVQTTPPVR